MWKYCSHPLIRVNNDLFFLCYLIVLDEITQTLNLYTLYEISTTNAKQHKINIRLYLK